MLAARERGEELGCTPIGPAGGATLRIARRATATARSVVEVGTGAGVSGLYLLGRHGRRTACSPRIDVEGEHQRAAKRGLHRGRHRAHALPADQRLGRRGAAAAARRRLRPRARRRRQVLLRRVLRAGAAAAAPRRRHGVRQRAVARPRRRPDSTRSRDDRRLRDLGKTVRDDARVLPAMLAVGDGLLVAAKR